MLTTDELRALIAGGEPDHVEFTVSTTNTDKFGEAICAFANDFPAHGQPGRLVVGIRDDGTVSGLTVTDDLLKRLAALRSNVNLEPLPAMTVRKYTLPDGDVAVVEVLPSDLPPVRYKGRVWVRVGPSRRGANQQEERIRSRNGPPGSGRSTSARATVARSTTWPWTCFWSPTCPPPWTGRSSPRTIAGTRSRWRRCGCTTWAPIAPRTRERCCSRGTLSAGCPAPGSSSSVGRGRRWRTIRSARGGSAAT